MKYIGLLTLILGLPFHSCCQTILKTENSGNKTEVVDTAEVSKNREEIQKLIRQVLIWSDSKESIDILPVITDSRDSVHIGFDLDKLKLNLGILRQTGFFATEFIENYNQIIRTLDRKLRNKEFEAWLVGDLPTFIFSNDYDPWWADQARFSIQFGTVELINLDKNKGECYFKCRDIGRGCEGLENY
jgi:hypothetical protein